MYVRFKRNGNQNFSWIIVYIYMYVTYIYCIQSLFSAFKNIRYNKPVALLVVAI